jgi:hypothetical protein
LKARLCQLCSRAQEAVDAETIPTHEQIWIRLHQELINSIDALFVFVANPQVKPTNNRSERNFRREAKVRKGGRTSKTQSGAGRRSIIMVALNTRFEQFMLQHLLDELANWTQLGLSRFQAELAGMTQATALSSA